MSDDDYDVGYKKPPFRNRFRKGQSSPNPAGRPKKTSTGNVLSNYITMTLDGELVEVLRSEAALFSLLKKGLKDRDHPALTAFLQNWAEIQPDRPKIDNQIKFIRGGPVDRTSCDELFDALGVLQQIPSRQPDRPPILAMTIWMLEEALKRFKGDDFSNEQIEQMANDTVDPTRAREILREYVSKKASGRGEYRKSG